MRSNPPQSAEPTLFARLGGTTGVSAFVDDFYARVLGDPQLAPFFKGVGMDKLRRMQLELFSAALEGPLQYTGRPIAQIHRHLRIGLGDYQRFVRHLFDTLAKYDLSEQDRYEIIGRLNVQTDDVVSGTGLVG